ncbi:hypothetical protein BCI9360_01743 [Bacillus sp. CECT 9360]|nr:hypothetical protein BCI9360_01743 [Bacillus sp. CECT 9360]
MNFTKDQTIKSLLIAKQTVTRIDKILLTVCFLLRIKV